MLASNIGIAANTHYCGGMVAEQSFSLGFEQLDCGMEKTQEICESTESEGLNAQPCCKNVHEILQAQQEANVKKSSIEVNPTFLVAFVFDYTSTLFSFEESTPTFREYIPPFVRQNVQILFQTFLI
ncbi:MAG: hypothetical protein ACJAQ4_001419 [Cryomorphaceae bacterium]|jgi:hypothetical protein